MAADSIQFFPILSYEHTSESTADGLGMTELVLSSIQAAWTSGVV